MYLNAMLLLTVTVSSFVLEAQSETCGSGPSRSSSTHSRRKRLSGGAIAGIVIGVAAMIYIFLICLLFCCILVNLRRYLSAEERGADSRPAIVTKKGLGGGRCGEIGMFGKNHTTSKPGVGLAAPQPAYAPGGQPGYDVV